MRKLVSGLVLILCAFAAGAQVQPRPAGGNQISSVSGNAHTIATVNGPLTPGDGVVNDSNGNLTDSGGPPGGSSTVAFGTATLGTTSIPSLQCATVVTVTATSVATTDTITWTPNASIKAVTGYAPSSAGGLSIGPYPSAGNVNFDVCNWTAVAITPGAVTLNWSVKR